MNFTVCKTGIVWIDSATEGVTVSYAVPEGCVLRRQEGETFVEESRPSPFVHSGSLTSYRIDCDEYDGIQKIAMFSKSND